MSDPTHDDACPGCSAPDLAFARHDHDHCAAGTLARAEALTEARGARLTPVRRRALEILLEEHRALGAYEVLERLAAEHDNLLAALDWYIEQGEASKAARLGLLGQLYAQQGHHQPLLHPSPNVLPLDQH